VSEFAVDLTELIRRLLQQRQQQPPQPERQCPPGVECVDANYCARVGGTCVASCPAGCCCKVPESRPQPVGTQQSQATQVAGGQEYTVDLTELIQKLAQQQQQRAGPFYLAGGTDGRALSALVSALDRLKSLGVQVPPPCRGDAYPVYVDGAVTAGSANAGNCVAEIRLPGAPDDQTALYHAVRALAMAARSASGANPTRAWYSEAVPEAVAQHVAGRCDAAREFFSRGLWAAGPYSAPEGLWRAYSASLLWALQQGRADVKSLVSARPDALERIHAEFLKALAASVPLCGSTFSASQLVKDMRRADVRAGTAARVPVSLDPLAAAYALVSWPASMQLRCAPPAGVECAVASRSPPAVLAVVNVSPRRVEGEVVLEAVAAAETPGTGAPPTGGREYTVDLTGLIQQILGQTGPTVTATATATTTTTATATVTAPTGKGEFTVDITNVIKQALENIKSGTPNYTYAQQQGSAWQSMGGSSKTGTCPPQAYLAQRELCTRVNGACVPGTEGDGTCCCYVPPAAPMVTTAPTAVTTAPTATQTAPTATPPTGAERGVERAVSVAVQVLPLVLLLNVLQMLREMMR